MSVDIEKLREPFPANAIRQRAGGGGRMLSYVEGHTVIRRLNEACAEWDFTIIREWQEGNLLKAQVQLCIPGLGCRQHVGVQVFSDRQGTEDVQAKGHITDALKKSATLFGVGLELYGPDYEAGEVAHHPVPVVNNSRDNRAAPNTNLQQQPSSPPQQRPQASSTAAITPSQIKYLWSLSAQKGWGNDGVYDYIRGTYGKGEVHELTRREASEMLDVLNTRPDAKPAGPRQEPQKGNPQGLPAFEEPEWLASAPLPDPDRWTN